MYRNDYGLLCLILKIGTVDPEVIEKIRKKLTQAKYVARSASLPPSGLNYSDGYICHRLSSIDGAQFNDSVIRRFMGIAKGGQHDGRKPCLHGNPPIIVG